MKTQDLLNKVKIYEPNCNLELINKAIDFTIKYHGKQLRDSGAPYYYHPLEVAHLVADLRLDENSIIAALLHDTLEDTELTREELEQHFGSTVLKLVEGVTKLKKIHFQKSGVKDTENFRKLFVAISEDVRVLVIKLLDRLHNMRTIDFIKSMERKRQIAIETLELYAPLAERIGMQKVKAELQDIAFRILHPDIYSTIVQRLNLVSTDDQVIQLIILELKNLLAKQGIQAQISGRRKNPYSTWVKMINKNIKFEQLADLIAFRVVVEKWEECYHTLGIIHQHYRAVSEHFQDFISVPKFNRYRSLHTVVLGPVQRKIEIQIRTQEMHQVAELGIAAHWRYKQKYELQDAHQYSWIQELINLLSQAENSQEFFHHTNLLMDADQVFGFTPQGRIVGLPKGSSIIDFAYAIHTDLGNHCIGAKVNGERVPLNYQVANGDQIEIITEDAATPLASWNDIVLTGKARYEIRKFLHNQDSEQYTLLGKNILHNTLNAAGIIDHEPIITKLVQAYEKPSLNELYMAVGEGSIDPSSVAQQLDIPRKRKSFFNAYWSLFSNSKNDKNHLDIAIKGLIPGVAIHFANCCHPLPGDKICGVINKGKGVTVHREECSVPKRNNEHEKLQLGWSKFDEEQHYPCRLKLTIYNPLESLVVIMREITKHDVEITNLKMAKKDNGSSELLCDIQISNTNKLNVLLKSLKTRREIYSVERQ